MRAWSRLVLLAAVIAASTLPLGSALAQDQIFDEYSIGLAAWAKPTVTGEIIDADTMRLGEDVSDVITTLVVRDANQFVPNAADLSEFCTGIAGSYFPDQTAVADLAVQLPSFLKGSLGYWGEDASGSSFLICSLHDDALYVFTLLSADTDAKVTQTLLTRMASQALTSGPPYQAGYYVEIMASQFGGERPLTDLPGRDEIPDGFQLVDRDYMLTTQ